jgi:DNA-directed RNA polymerase sigma subunit (sigma70/sigma32)
MRTYLWASDEGWPYPDSDPELVDLNSEADDDLAALRAAGTRILSHLDQLEREVVTARFGLDGHGARSMKEIRAMTGLDHAHIRETMGSALEKLRADLA